MAYRERTIGSRAYLKNHVKLLIYWLNKTCDKAVHAEGVLYGHDPQNWMRVEEARNSLATANDNFQLNMEKWNSLINDHCVVYDPWREKGPIGTHELSLREKRWLPGIIEEYRDAVYPRIEEIAARLLREAPAHAASAPPAAFTDSHTQASSNAHTYAGASMTPPLVMTCFGQADNADYLNGSRSWSRWDITDDEAVYAEDQWLPAVNLGGAAEAAAEAATKEAAEAAAAEAAVSAKATQIAAVVAKEAAAEEAANRAVATKAAAAAAAAVAAELAEKAAAAAATAYVTKAYTIRTSAPAAAATANVAKAASAATAAATATSAAATTSSAAATTRGALPRSHSCRQPRNPQGRVQNSPPGSGRRAGSADPPIPPKPDRFPGWVSEAYNPDPRFDVDWTLCDDYSEELRRREQRDRLTINRLQRGQNAYFKSSGRSLEPRVKSGDGCTYVPIRDSDINLEDIVFCAVQPHNRIFAHRVTKISFCYGKPFYTIANKSGHENGWCYREHIYGKLSHVNGLPLPAYQNEYDWAESKAQYETSQTWSFGY